MATRGFYRVIATHLWFMHDCRVHMAEAPQGSETYRDWEKAHNNHRLFVENLCVMHCPRVEGIESLKLDLSASTWNKLKFNVMRFNVRQEGMESFWTDHVLIVGADLKDGVRLHLVGMSFGKNLDPIYKVFRELQDVQVESVS